ncbi:MAG: hypothetical protein AAFV85_27395 [Cyanobacteria bacterium J06634_6]
MRVCEPFELAYPKAQEKREQQQDQQAEEWGFALLELAELVRRWGKEAISRELASLPDTAPAAAYVKNYKPTCNQCVNWRPPRALQLANGTSHQSIGFCEARAAAEMEQMPKEYAERCRLYEEKIPF